jgi:predicted NAD/FAD-dependent oxidoreductase
MSRFVKHLLDLDSPTSHAGLGATRPVTRPTVVPSATARAITRDGAGFRITLESGSADVFDAVVVAVPATGAAALLHGVSPLADILSTVRYHPAWVAWCELPDDAGRLPFDGLDAVSPAIRFAAASSSKARREEQRVWSLISTPEWAATRLDLAPGAIAEALTADFASRFPTLGHLTPLGAHRWRDARVIAPLGVDCGQDPTGTLIAVGDAFLGSTVENAWLSGVAGAGALLRYLGSVTPPEDPGFRRPGDGAQLALPLD